MKDLNQSTGHRWLCEPLSLAARFRDGTKGSGAPAFWSAFRVSAKKEDEEDPWGRIMSKSSSTSSLGSPKVPFFSMSQVI